MKKLTDYKDEIHKCSKCGLCQSVCPIYKETGNDCAVSRGKFIMLNGIIKGDLKLNKNINKYLDMCLKCNACKDFCPSGIDAREIFLTAKHQYFNKCFFSSIPTKFFQSAFVFKTFMHFSKFASNAYRGLHFDHLARKSYSFLLKFGWVGKKMILANEFLTLPKIKAKPQATQPPKILNVIYFKGCVNEFINSRTQKAVEQLLDKVGAKILPIQFQCCGMPFLSSGNLEQFKKQAEFNISQIPDDFDYFITDCASCQSAFKDYEKYINDEKLLKKLKKINQKSINIVDFILNQVRSIEFDKKIKFTFHKPCHMNDLSFFQKFLNMSKNVEYIEMEDFDTCCGFSGEFAIKNKKLSAAISAKKAKNIIKTNVDCVLTSCPACILGLKQGMIEIGESIQAINFIELLSIANFKLNSDYENEDCDKKLLDAFVRKCF